MIPAHKKRVAVALNRDLLCQVDRLARLAKVNRSTVVAAALTAQLRRIGPITPALKDYLREMVLHDNAPLGFQNDP